MQAGTYRATPRAYARAGTIAAVASLLWLIAVWRLGAPWLPILVPLGGFALVALRLLRYRLTFAPRGIELVTPLQTRRVALAEVLSIEFVEESGGGSSGRLCIRTCSGVELHLDARVFSTVAVQRLLALAPRRTATEASRPALTRSGFRPRAARARPGS